MNKITVITTAALFTLQGTVAWAVNYNWAGTNGVQGSWSDTNNWNPTGLPASTTNDNAVISNGGIAYIGNGDVVTVRDISVAGTSSLIVDGNNMSVRDLSVINSGELRISNAAVVTVTRQLYVAGDSAPQIIIEGGSIVSASQLQLGYMDDDFYGTGSMIITEGSQFNLAGGFAFQPITGTGGAPFELTLADGGVFNASATDLFFGYARSVINFGNGAGVGSITAQSIVVDNNTIINFNTSDAYTFNTVMVDRVTTSTSTASLNQIGTGTTTLVMMHNGTVSVNNGKLVLDSSSIGSTDILLMGANAVNIGGAATVGVLELSAGRENALINDSAPVSFLGNGVLSVAGGVVETLGSVNVTGTGNGIDFSGGDNLLTINTLTLDSGYVLNITGWTGEYSLDGLTLLSGSSSDTIEVNSIVGDLGDISWDFTVAGYEFQETLLINGHLIPVFSQIPEPSSYAMIFGLAGLSAIACRRRRK